MKMTQKLSQYGNLKFKGHISSIYGALSKPLFRLMAKDYWFLGVLLGTGPKCNVFVEGEISYLPELTIVV